MKTRLLIILSGILVSCFSFAGPILYGDLGFLVGQLKTDELIYLFRSSQSSDYSAFVGFPGKMREVGVKVVSLIANPDPDSATVFMSISDPTYNGTYMKGLTVYRGLKALEIVRENIQRAAVAACVPQISKLVRNSKLGEFKNSSLFKRSGK